MYSVSNDFKNYILQPSRIISSKVLINSIEYDDTYIIDMNIEEAVNPSEGFMIGSTSSAKLQITLNGISAFIFEGAEIKPYIGLDIGSSIEYVPLGVFTADEITKVKDNITLICFDNMIKTENAYFSELTYPASIHDVAQEICIKAGLTLSGTLPSTQVTELEGYTYREVISYIASFLGGFSRFNRDGELEFATYTDSSVSITGDNYIDFKTGEKTFTIGKITCKVDDTTTLTAGTTGNEIQFENPLMTQTQLESIYTGLSAISYMPYTMNWQGDPALMAGDKITITDIENNVYTTLLMEQKITYKGGLRASASAKAKTDNATEFSSNGTISQKLKRYTIEQANIKVLLAEKATIAEFNAVDARIDNLYAIDLVALNADIENLQTNKLNVATANAEFANINTLLAAKATITDLDVEKARINVIEGDYATLTYVNSEIADIDTILSKNIFVELATAGQIVAGSSIIADGAIGSAQISELSASKLTAGIADLALVTIQGTNGRLKIADNLLQVFDGVELFERIALGDINGDGSEYGMRIRGADGTTILFDENGQTAEGFTDGYGKLVNDSLDPIKLDIAQTVTRINNGISTIESAKIALDGGTLDAKFSELTTTVGDQGELISTHSASILVNSNAIALKANQTDFNEVESRLITAEGSLIINSNEIATKASQTEVDGIEGRLRTAEGSITTNANNIALKVAQTDFDTLGGRVTTAELDIDGLNSSISLKADSTVVSGIDIRLSSAELDIDGLGSEITLKVSKNDIVNQINLSNEGFTIDASKINLVGAVTVLSDITGNLGTMTAGTLTGGTIQTATSGDRLKFDSTSLKGLNEYNNTLVELTYNALEFNVRTDQGSLLNAATLTTGWDYNGTSDRIADTLFMNEGHLHISAGNDWVGGAVSPILSLRVNASTEFVGIYSDVNKGAWCIDGNLDMKNNSIDDISEMYISGNGKTIGGANITNAWLRVGSTFGIDSNELYFTTSGIMGTIGNYDLSLRHNSLEKLRLVGGGVNIYGDLVATGSVNGRFYNAGWGHAYSFIEGTYASGSALYVKQVSASDDVFTCRSNNHNNVLTIGRKESYNHTFMRNSYTAIKMLNSSMTQVQCRNAADTAYVDIKAAVVNYTSLVNYSDKINKENIESLNVSALDTLKDIKIYEYDYKSNMVRKKKNQKKHIGAMYDEVPELLRVHTENKDDREGNGIDITKLMYLNIKGIQELYEENILLKARIEKLEKRIA